MAWSETTEVCILAAIIAGSILVLGVLYKKVIAPMIAQRYPDSQPLNGHAHGGHSHSPAKKPKQAHEDYEKHTELGSMKDIQNLKALQA